MRILFQVLPSSIKRIKNIQEDKHFVMKICRFQYLMPHVQNKVSGACRREAQALLLPSPAAGKTFKGKRAFLHLNLRPEGSENCPNPSESDSKTSPLHFDCNLCHPYCASFLTKTGSSFLAFKQKGMHCCQACHSGGGLQRAWRGRQFQLCQGD